MQFLLFQIYAPLVSWGEIAVGGERQSSRQPSKSAIVGLVSAALGIKREEEERLNALSYSMGVAVQLYSGGFVLKDFHTAQVPRSKSKVVYHTRREELLGLDEKDNAIISYREYRCDALSVVAIYLKKTDLEFSLQSIESALREPEFQLYFGRKSSVPSLPLAPKIVNKPNLKEAFSEYSVEFPIPIKSDALEWMKKIYSQYPRKTLYDDTGISYFWEASIDSGFEELQSVERYDQPTSRKRWQFTSRRECMTIEKSEEATNVHQ